MKILKLLITVFGGLMVAMGCLWIGQGLNIIRWPETSFMLGKAQWSWNGMFLAVAGAVLIWWSRRK